MYVDTKHLINRKIIKIIVKNKMLPINRDNLKYHFFGGRSYIIFQFHSNIAELNCFFY